METAFIRTAFEAMGHLAAAVQVAVPFAVLGVGEVGECVVMGALEALEILSVAGDLVIEQMRVEGFAVRPPQFHVPFQRSG